MNLAKQHDTEVNTQKSVAFLYTDNEQSEKELTKTIALTVASRRIKYLGINKEMKDLHKENYKTLLKLIKDDSPCSWIGRLNVKMSVLPKEISRFNTITINIPMVFSYPKIL